MGVDLGLGIMIRLGLAAMLGYGMGYNRCRSTLKQISDAVIGEPGTSRLFGYPLPCLRCKASGWICIHCDKAPLDCRCKDNGSRNLALCDQCAQRSLREVRDK